MRESSSGVSCAPEPFGLPVAPSASVFARYRLLRVICPRPCPLLALVSARRSSLGLALRHRCRFHSPLRPDSSSLFPVLPNNPIFNRFSSLLPVPSGSHLVFYQFSDGRSLVDVSRPIEDRIIWQDDRLRGALGEKCLRGGLAGTGGVSFGGSAMRGGGSRRADGWPAGGCGMGNGKICLLLTR